MNVAPNSNSPNTSLLSTNNEDKQLVLIEKFLCDLEDIVKRLVEIQGNNKDEIFSDDCVELQKFCFKFEFLIQFKLKEKKGLFDTSALSISSNTSGDTSQNLISVYSSKDYWGFINDVLKSSRSFQDAIKYVKNLKDVKTNIGRGRAFIRFCLQYHRLADAIQQLMMEDKVIKNWYQEKAVWHDESQKSRIFQLLYDLSDLNFELLSKSNFELDTTWPTLGLNNPKIQVNRQRRDSFTSYASYYIEKEQGDSLLSSTPLQMDHDFLISKMNQSLNMDNKSLDLHSSYQMEIEQQESKINELTKKLEIKDNQLDTVLDELKHKNNDSVFNTETYSNETSKINSPSDNDSTMFLEKMAAQIQVLNDQLMSKTTQNNELNSCLTKQTNLCENLSSLLKQNQEKLAVMEKEKAQLTETNNQLQGNFDTLNKEYNKLKIDSNAKEEALVKETLSQTQSIISLQQVCSKHEATINQLQLDLDTIRKEKQKETKENAHTAQKNKVSIEQKDEENNILNNKIETITRMLVEERKDRALIDLNLDELKTEFQKTTEINKAKIEQLEDDNNEIKKRLVKLIKEKAELWQKADNLEYENMLKANAMWVDDANVSHCLNCNSGFNLLLRKHHCRMCLKIFCYYCCNNWVDYNNSKLRVCQRCFESKNHLAQLGQDIPKISTKTDIPTVEHTNKPLGIEIITDHTNDNLDNDEESDPDINFEVRSKKLNLSMEKVNVSAFNSAGQSSSDTDCGRSIYDTTKTKTKLEPVVPIVNSTAEVSTPLTSEAEKPKEEEKEISSEKVNLLKELIKQSDGKVPVSIYSDENSDLIVRKKKIVKRKKKLSESHNNMDDFISAENKLNKSYPFADDSFTILSQDEIDRVK